MQIILRQYHLIRRKYTKQRQLVQIFLRELGKFLIILIAIYPKAEQYVTIFRSHYFNHTHQLHLNVVSERMVKKTSILKILQKNCNIFAVVIFWFSWDEKDGKTVTLQRKRMESIREIIER